MKVKGLLRVAIQMRMRGDKEQFDANAIELSFSALNDEFLTFYFSRFVARKESPIDTDFVPSKSAVISEKSELMRHQVLVGPLSSPFCRSFLYFKRRNRVSSFSWMLEQLKNPKAFLLMLFYGGRIPAFRLLQKKLLYVASNASA